MSKPSTKDLAEEAEKMRKEIALVERENKLLEKKRNNLKSMSKLKIMIAQP